MTTLPFGPASRRLCGPWYSASAGRALAATILILIAALTAAPAQGQPLLDIFSTNQVNSNPNEVPTGESGSGTLSDFVGEHGLWFGYSLRPEDNIRILPSYTLAMTLWGNASEQNLIQHNLSLSFRYDGLKLFGYREPPPSEGDTELQDRTDSAKSRLVSRIDAVADMLDSAVYTRRAATAPDSAVEMPDDSLFDALDELEEDVLGFDEEMDLAELEEGAGGAVTPGAHDSLLARMVDRLDGASDTLDVFAGTSALADHVADVLRSVRDMVRREAGNDPVAASAAAQLDALILDLGRYAPAASDDEWEELADDANDLAALSDAEYAPLSLSHQSLIRNLPVDYYFYTGREDAGADYLRVSAGGGVARYINTDDPALLLYNVNMFNASVLLEQRLSKSVSMWGSYSISSDVYPEADIFSNTQHEFVAQLRYVPSATVMLVADAGYGLRNYSGIARADTTQESSKAQRITSTEQTTSLLTFGAGAFFRPGPSTVLGAALGYQETPVLHPRFTLGFSGGRVRVLSDLASTLSDDVFSWQGPSFQALAMQMLPGEILASLHLLYESRDYGRPTINVRGNSVQLRDRIDSRTTLELGLAREFALNSDATSFLSLGLKAGMVRNASTEYSRSRVQLPSNDFREGFVELGLSWDPF